MIRGIREVEESAVRGEERPHGSLGYKTPKESFAASAVAPADATDAPHGRTSRSTAATTV